MAVQTKADLEQWEKWLEQREVKHSQVLKGFSGWVPVAEDCDGRKLRWYTLETHEWTMNIDHDQKWLGDAAVWPEQGQ